jgi:hypothetical protein
MCVARQRRQRTERSLLGFPPKAKNQLVLEPTAQGFMVAVYSFARVEYRKTKKAGKIKRLRIRNLKLLRVSALS